MKKRIVSVLLCGILLFELTGCGKKKEEIKSDESNNSAIVDELNSKIKTLEEENNKFKSKDCRYTETYFFVDYYDYQGTVPTDKYIIVDKFQAQEPIIIRYNSSKFNINFEKGKNYEFTFTSIISNGVEDKKTVVDIKPTEKLGLEQIQESCYYDDNVVKTDNAIAYEQTILNNMDSIMEVSDLSSSNPYDYIDNNHYRSIVALGSGAVSVLEDMYNSGKLTELKAYISALAIEDITGCHLSTKYNWSSAEEFYNLWKTDNCGFEY